MFLSRGLFGLTPSPLVIYQGHITVGKYGPWYTSAGHYDTYAGRYDVGSLSPSSVPTMYNNLYLVHETESYIYGPPYRQSRTWMRPDPSLTDFDDFEYDVTLAGQTVRFKREAGNELYVAVAGDVFNLQNRNGQTLPLTVVRLFV